MTSVTVSETALNRHYIGHTFVDEAPHLTIASFYSAVRLDLQRTLDEYISGHEEWKTHACLQVIVSKGEDERPAHFHIHAVTLQSYSLDNEVVEMERRLDEFTTKGSGWKLARVDKLEWRLTQFNSIPFHVGHARGYKLPPKLAAKKAVINVSDVPEGECFKFAVLAALYHNDIPYHNERASKYRPWLHKLDFTRITLPFQACDLPAFERRNHTLAINLLEWKNDGHATLARGSPVTEGRTVINILIVDNHYVGVVNVDRLLNDNNAHNRQVRKYCNRCLRPFYSQIKLNEHMPACVKNEQRQYNMPRPGKNTLSFTNLSKTISPSFVIYGDIECMILSDGTHKPIMCGYLVVPNSKLDFLHGASSTYNSFVGTDCIRQFLSHLRTTVQTLIAFNEEYGREKMKVLTPVQEYQHHVANACYLCHTYFDPNEKSRMKVRDHDHFSGQYLGPACNGCNLLRRNRRSSFPIVFHNLRGYDVHHLVKEGVGHFPDWDLSVIPTTKEGYLSLRCSFGKNNGFLQFIDSLQFLSASLATLVSNCPSLPLTSKLQGSDEVKNSKGMFPYNFLDCEEKLRSTHLPPQSAFFDELNQSPLSDADYRIAQKAWQEFGCETFGDYTAAYLRLDVHQLADVFEAFRGMALDQDGLDPVNYVSLPGLSWDSALKMTGTRVELLTDSHMYEFFESGIRGGMTFVNRHRVERTANTELLYVDANNLYGQALSMKLPQSGFKWVESVDERQDILNSLPEMDVLESDMGYVFEVDMEIPPELHDLLDDLPLAPENRCVQQPTPYMMELWSLAEGRRGYRAGPKLILSHLPKEHYVVHFAVLQLYLQMGAIITKIHRVVSFRQSRFFESYISFNSQKRQAASNEFEKDFFKLKNNSLFGKTMENVRNRIDYRLCNTPQKLVSYSSRPLFLSAMRFSEDLVGVELLKGVVELGKPVFIGQAVLDLSKLIMYRLRYQKLPEYEKKFGGSIRVVAGDTDSFFLEVRDICVAEELLPAMKEDGLLDSSNYPRDHPLYSLVGKAELGRIKDECAGTTIIDAIFLRPKCYSLLMSDGKEHKRAKGVQRSVLRQEISHQDYVNVVESAVPLYATVRGFKSTTHIISTVTTQKRAISLFEDKRSWVSEDKSFAYGHCSISLYEPPTKKLRFSIDSLIGL